MSPQATTALAIILAANIAENLALHPLSDEYIDHINSLNTTWKAGRNFHPDTPLSSIKNLLGALKSTLQLPKKTHFPGISDFKIDNFDPRTKWPYCPSLNEIRDQGPCGSCWAHGAAEMMTDRYCIQSKGQKHFHFSAEDLTTCRQKGCQGGNHFEALKSWEDNGVVSGGNYGSGEGCRPYTIKNCDHTGQDKSNPCEPIVETPKCWRTCQSNYSVTYDNDLNFAERVFWIDGSLQIELETAWFGPVVAAFTVYEDFLSYKSGVYQRVSDKVLGRHVVKILGWGEENGLLFWLCANSWNTNFGDKGFFKILRGSNHCGIEEEVAAGKHIMEV